MANKRWPEPAANPIIMAKKMAINLSEPLVAERKRDQTKRSLPLHRGSQTSIDQKITKVIIQGSKVKLMTNSRV